MLMTTCALHKYINITSPRNTQKQNARKAPLFLDGLGHYAKILIELMLKIRACSDSGGAGGDSSPFLQQPAGAERCTWIERVLPSKCTCVCSELEGERMQHKCRALCGSCTEKANAAGAMGTAHSETEHRDRPSIVYFEDVWTDKGLYLSGLAAPGMARDASLYCHETGPVVADIHRRLHTTGGFDLDAIYECNYMPPLDAWFMFDSIATNNDGGGTGVIPSMPGAVVGAAPGAATRERIPRKRRSKSNTRGQSGRHSSSQLMNSSSRRAYAKLYQASRQGIVPCGRAPHGFTRNASVTSSGGTPAALRPYEVALHLRLGDLLANRAGAMSNQNFTSRAQQELVNFREALHVLAKVRQDVNDLVSKTVPAPSPLPPRSLNPHVHVLVMSDSSPAVIAKQLRHHGITIAVVEEWNDGVSDLTTCTLDADGIRTPITVDFLTAGNPLAALHCLSSADLLIGGSGNFISLATLMALGAPHTTRITTAGITKPQQHNSRMGVVLERMPDTLAKSKWFEAERHRRRRLP